jgi:tetratricopeptide (TPR) repeat protein
VATGNTSERERWQGLELVERLVAESKLAQALTLAQELRRNALQHPDFLGHLAWLFSSLRDYQSAQDLYLAAIAVAPQEAGLRYNLATVLRVNGDLEAAERELDKAITLDPDDADAWLLRSGLREQTTQSNHVAGLQRQLAQPGRSVASRVKLRYALAKELEDIGRYEASFSSLKQGADLFRGQIQYDLQRDLDALAAIRQTFAAEFFRANGAAGHETSEPIFIVGLPRAGSTLLERILGCSAEVQLVGELNNFAHCLQEHMGRQFPGWQPTSLLDRVRKSRELEWAPLGERYLLSTRPYTGGKRCFVDKMPLNFLYIGMIRRALPDARIIHIRREEMDHCHAMYKHLFNHAYPFSYQLDELARYFLGYRQLMQHWHEQLPGVIHEVQYEALVTRPEATARSLYDFCGLAWEPHCLDFHAANQQPSGTGSASQIRRPLNDSAIGRWRHYATQLAPLSKWLQSASFIPQHPAGPGRPDQNL